MAGNEWTFLLYANGQNELEPELWQSVLDIAAHAPCRQVQTLVQISREEKEIVRLLRPERAVPDAGDDWSGVRRYVFAGTDSAIFHTLDPVNMADPASLHDFLCWGISNYPANRYLLSISGHIYQFVGLCPDYSGEQPYMLGFPELSDCIQNTCQEMNVSMDILILDTCYASTVEILYEMAKHKELLIKHVLTYIGKGPLKGLPYQTILSVLDSTTSNETSAMLKKMAAQLKSDLQGYGLLAVSLDYVIFQKIKQLFSLLASTYLSCERFFYNKLTPEELLLSYNQEYPWAPLLPAIQTLLQEQIIVQCKSDDSVPGLLPVHILYQKIPDTQRRFLYGRLAFAKENHWMALLCDAFDEPVLPNLPQSAEPLTISRTILKAFIYSSNEHMALPEQERLVRDLIEKKGWNFDE